jgi:hypothetical protein
MKRSEQIENKRQALQAKEEGLLKNIDVATHSMEGQLEKALKIAAIAGAAILMGTVSYKLFFESKDTKPKKNKKEAKKKIKNSGRSPAVNSFVTMAVSKVLPFIIDKLGDHKK